MARIVQKMNKRKSVSAVFIVLLTAVYLFSTAAYAQEPLKDTKSYINGGTYTADSLSYGEVWAFDEATYNASRYKGATGTYTFYNSTGSNNTNQTTENVAYWNPITFNNRAAVTGTKVTVMEHSKFFVNNTAGTRPSPVVADQTIPTMTTASTGTYTVIPNSTGDYRVYIYSESGAPSTGNVKYFLINSADTNNSFAAGTAEFVQDWSFTRVSDDSNWYYADLNIGVIGWGAFQPSCSGDSGSSSKTDTNTGTFTSTAITDTTLGGTYYFNVWSKTEVRFNTLLVLQWDSSVELGPISKVGNTITITPDADTTDSDTGTVTVRNIFGETVTADGTAQPIAQAPLFFEVKASEGSVFTGSEGAALTQVADGVYRYDYETTSTLSFQWSQAESFPVVSLSGNAASGKIDFLAQKSVSGNYTIGSAGNYTLTADFTGADDNTVTYEVYFGGKPENGGVLQTSGTLTPAAPSCVITPGMDSIYVRMSPTKYAAAAAPVGEVNIAAIPNASLPQVAHNITTDKKYAYIEDAILEAASGDTIVLIANASFQTAQKKLDWTNNNAGYTVKAGVTLLLPYAASDTTIKSSTGENSFEHANVAFMSNKNGDLNPATGLQYTLTIPNTVTVYVADGTSGSRGRIVVGGQLGGAEGYEGYHQGATYDKHSNLQVDGTLVLGDYSVLSATGYVTGAGTITTQNGEKIATDASIYQPFVILDWHGAGASALFMTGARIDTRIDIIQSGESQISPYIHWGVTNIRTNISLNEGNQMYGYAFLFEDDTAYCSVQAMVAKSDSEGALILSQGATLASSYQALSKPMTPGFPGRMNLTVSGGAALGTMSMGMNMGLLVGDVNINTKNFTFPIPYIFNISLNVGEYYIENSVGFLPGSSLKVNSGATLHIGESSSVRVMFYEGLLNRVSHNNGLDAFYIDYAEARKNRYNYPTATELQNAKYSGDAELIVNGGKVVICDNASFGGLIQTNGSGTVENKKTTTPTVTVQVGVVGTKSVNFNDRHVAGMSLHIQNGRLSYFNEETGTEDIIDIAGSTTYYAHGSDIEQVKTSFAFDYYPDAFNVATVIHVGENATAYGSDETLNKPACSLGSAGEVIRGEWCTQKHDSTTLIAIAAKEPTCSETGNEAYYYCEICGRCYEDADGTTLTTLEDVTLPTIPHPIDAATGHTARVEPLCGVAGNVEYWTCSVCGWHFSDAEGTNKLETVVIEALEHLYANANVSWQDSHDGKYTVKVTCSRTGCGQESTSEVLSAAGTSDPGNCQTNSSTTYTAEGSYQGVNYSGTDIVYGDYGAHVWSTEWTTDGTSHWRKCSIEGCTEVTEKADHAVGDNGTAATCTAKAVCGTCGASYGDLEPHSYSDSWSSDGTNHWRECTECGDKTDLNAHSGGKATCTAQAVCETCAASYGELAAHIWSTEWSHDETNHWHACTNQDCSEKNQEIAHNGGTASCTEQAICGICKEPYGDTLPHSYTVASDSLVSEATCTEPAMYWAKCSVPDCGDVSTTETIPVGEALGHKYESSSVKFSDDKTTYTVTVTCSRSQCTVDTENHELTSDALPSVVSGAANNCQTTGTLTYTAKGAFEGVPYEATATEENVAGPHSLVKTEAKAATCSEAGNYAYWTCQVENCGKVFADENAETETTVEAQTIPIDENAHSWEEKSSTASCIQAGTTHYTCAYNPDHTKTEATEALGHSWTTTETAASCTTPAYTETKCSRCGYSYITVTGDPPGHSFADGVCGSCGTLGGGYIFSVSHNLNLLDLVQIGYWVQMTEADSPQPAEAAETAEATEAAEASETTGTTEAAEASETTEAAEDAETTDTTEAADAAGISEAVEAADTTGAARAVDLTNATYGIDVWAEGKKQELTLSKRGGYYQAYAGGVLAQLLNTPHYACPYIEVDGQKYYSATVDKFAVTDYAAMLFKNGYTAGNPTHDVVRDLVNYATNAQNYFRTRNGVAIEKETPINASLKTEYRDSRYTADMKVTGGKVNGTEWYGSTINLDEAIALNFYANTADFTHIAYIKAAAYDESIENVTQDSDGAQTLMLDTSGSRPLAKFTNIYPKDMGIWYYGCMYNEEGSYSSIRVDSVNAYLTRGIAASEVPDSVMEPYMVDTFKDMLAYGDSARKYADSVNSSTIAEGE